jgi:hypothetical protein
MSRSQHADPTAEPQTIDEKRKGIIATILRRMAELRIAEEVQDESKQTLVYNDFVDHLLPKYIPIMLEQSNRRRISLEVLMEPYLDEIRDFLYEKITARKEQAEREQADQERANQKEASLTRIENFPFELQAAKDIYEQFQAEAQYVISTEEERQRVAAAEIARTANHVENNLPTLFNNANSRAEKRIEKLMRDNRERAIAVQAQVNYLQMTIGRLSSQQTLTALNHRSFEAINLYLENLKIVFLHYEQYQHPPYFPAHMARISEHMAHANVNFSILSSPKLADLFASLTHNAHRLTKKEIDAAIKENQKREKIYRNGHQSGEETDDSLGGLTP